MADTPKRSQVLLTASAQVLYTAPTNAAQYGILRTVQVCNESATAATVTLGMNTTLADAAGKRMFYQVSVPGNQIIEWTGFIPLLGHATTPDIFYGLAGTASVLTVTSGIIEGP